MDGIELGLKNDDLAIQCHVAGEGLPVDVVLQAVRNVGPDVGMQLLGKVGGAAVLARIIVKRRTRLFQIIAEMSIKFRAKGPCSVMNSASAQTLSKLAYSLIVAPSKPS